MQRKGLQKRFGDRFILINTEMCIDKWPDQPCPYRALVIGVIALQWVTLITRCVTRFATRQAAQPMGGQQLTGAYIDDRFLLCGFQRTVWQRNRKQLIGSQAIISIPSIVVRLTFRAINYVVKATAHIIPEALKTRLNLRGRILVVGLSCISAKIGGKGGHDL